MHKLGAIIKIPGNKTVVKNTLDLLSKYMDTQERAFGCLASSNVHKRVRSLKASRWSFVTPETLISVWDWYWWQTPSLILSSWGSMYSDDITMNFNLESLAFFAFSSNYFQDLIKHHFHMATSVTQNYILHSCKSYSFPWIKKRSFIKTFKCKGPSMEPWEHFLRLFILSPLLKMRLTSPNLYDVRNVFIAIQVCLRLQIGT